MCLSYICVVEFVADSRAVGLLKEYDVFCPQVLFKYNFN